MTAYSSDCRSAVGLGHRAGRLELAALVHEQRGVAAVVEDEVGAVDAARPTSRRSGRCSHQYSSSVSPFQAKPARPPGRRRPVGPTATAAAASSCVEKMLQLAQRTCAPSATSVSMSTAVCTVMCSEPAMRAPASGCSGPNSSRRAMRPGISFSARRIWWRPASASERSATLKGRGRAEISGAVDCGIRPFFHGRLDGRFAVLQPVTVGTRRTADGSRGVSRP